MNILCSSPSYIWIKFLSISIINSILMISVFLLYSNFAFIFNSISMWLKQTLSFWQSSASLLLYSLERLKWFYYIPFVFMTQQQCGILGILLEYHAFTTCQLLCQVDSVITQLFFSIIRDNILAQITRKSFLKWGSFSLFDMFSLFWAICIALSENNSGWTCPLSPQLQDLRVL